MCPNLGQPRRGAVLAAPEGPSPSSQMQRYKDGKPVRADTTYAELGQVEPCSHVQWDIFIHWGGPGRGHGRLSEEIVATSSTAWTSVWAVVRPSAM